MAFSGYQCKISLFSRIVLRTASRMAIYAPRFGSTRTKFAAYTRAHSVLVLLILILSFGLKGIVSLAMRKAI